MVNKLEPMIQAKIKKDIDSATGGDLTNYYTKTESDNKFALKTTVDTIEDNLTDYIVSKEVTIIGDGAGATVSIAANSGVWVDSASYITNACPTGYKAVVPYIIAPTFINTAGVDLLFIATDGKIRVVNRTSETQSLSSFKILATYIRNI